MAFVVGPLQILHGAGVPRSNPLLVSGGVAGFIRMRQRDEAGFSETGFHGQGACDVVPQFRRPGIGIPGGRGIKFGNFFGERFWRGHGNLGHSFLRIKQ